MELWMPPLDELLALSSVEMRRRIGTKEISPVELVKASIARIEALDPTVNAIAARNFARARKLAVSAESAARKGEQLGALHGLPTGIKDLHETAGLLTTYARRSIVTMCRRMTRPCSRSCARQAQSFSARPTCRNLARAPIRAMPFGAQPEIPSTRGSMPAAPRAARRSRSPATCSRFAPAPILRVLADPSRDLRRRGFSSLAGRRADGWPAARLDADLGAGPHGPQRRGSAASILGADRNGRPRAVGVPARCSCDRGHAAGGSRSAARRSHRRFWTVPRECRDTPCLPQPHRGHAATFPHV